MLTLRDVTERRAMEDALRHQAFHDALTGLPNRALFDDRLTQALRRTVRGETQVAVVLVDLDDCKAVNDSLGHAAGDALHVEASIGVARALPGLSPLDVVRNADIAMYAAKDLGGADHVVFRPEMLNAARERLDLREGLRHAPERGELELHHQPVVRLDDREGFAETVRAPRAFRRSASWSS